MFQAPAPAVVTPNLGAPPVDRPRRTPALDVQAAWNEKRLEPFFDLMHRGVIGAWGDRIPRLVLRTKRRTVLVAWAVQSPSSIGGLVPRIWDR